MELRSKEGSKGAITGIGVNVALCVMKFALGLITHSVAITADAANNLSDALGSVVALFSMRLANKPVDKEHPFGHGRMEYVGGLFVGILILLMGVELLKSGIAGIMHPQVLTFNVLSFALMGLSICAKLFLYFFYNGIDKKIDSATMKAAAKDSLSDVIATSGIIISMLAMLLLSWPVDGYVGVIVALIVLKAGIEVCRETVDSLLGGKLDKALGEELTQMLLKYDGILGTHDLVIHDYGPGRCIASVHAEISADEDLVAIHEVIDLAEREIGQRLNMPICIHMDPIVTDDEQTNAVQAQMTGFLKHIDSRLKLHDFRRVPGDKQINLIFDVLLPLDYKDEQALKEKISAYALTLDERYQCVLHFDRDFFR